MEHTKVSGDLQGAEYKCSCGKQFGSMYAGERSFNTHFWIWNKEHTTFDDIGDPKLIFSQMKGNNIQWDYWIMHAGVHPMPELYERVGGWPKLRYQQYTEYWENINDREKLDSLIEKRPAYWARHSPWFIMYKHSKGWNWRGVYDTFERAHGEAKIYGVKLENNRWEIVWGKDAPYDDYAEITIGVDPYKHIDKMIHGIRIATGTQSVLTKVQDIDKFLEKADLLRELRDMKMNAITEGIIE